MGVALHPFFYLIGSIDQDYRTWPERFAWGNIREMQHFVQSIQGETPPKVGGEDRHWVVAGVPAGNRSWLEERPITSREVLASM